MKDLTKWEKEVMEEGHVLAAVLSCRGGSRAGGWAALCPRPGSTWTRAPRRRSCGRRCSGPWSRTRTALTGWWALFEFQNLIKHFRIWLSIICIRLRHYFAVQNQIFWCEMSQNSFFILEYRSEWSPALVHTFCNVGVEFGRAQPILFEPIPACSRCSTWRKQMSGWVFKLISNALVQRGRRKSLVLKQIRFYSRPFLHCSMFIFIVSVNA